MMLARSTARRMMEGRAARRSRHGRLFSFTSASLRLPRSSRSLTTTTPTHTHSARTLSNTASGVKHFRRAFSALNSSSSATVSEADSTHTPPSSSSSPPLIDEPDRLHPPYRSLSPEQWMMQPLLHNGLVRLSPPLSPSSSAVGFYRTGEATEELPEITNLLVKQVGRVTLGMLDKWMREHELGVHRYAERLFAMMCEMRRRQVEGPTADDTPIDSGMYLVIEQLMLCYQWPDSDEISRDGGWWNGSTAYHSKLQLRSLWIANERRTTQPDGVIASAYHEPDMVCVVGENKIRRNGTETREDTMAKVIGYAAAAASVHQQRVSQTE